MFSMIVFAVFCANIATIGAVAGYLMLVRNEENAWAMLLIVVIALFMAFLGMQVRQDLFQDQSAQEAQPQQP